MGSCVFSRVPHKDGTHCPNVVGSHRCPKGMCEDHAWTASALAPFLPRALTFISLVLFAAAAWAADDTVLDAVLASVNGKPITLQDVSARLEPPRRVGLSEASRDLEVRQVLDLLILESLVEEEAEVRRIKVADEEIDAYIDEVARRNQLSRFAFEEALKQQGKDIAAYRRFVTLDIMRSRIAAQISRSAPAIPQKEIDDYIAQHPSLGRKGSKLKLRQIFISASERTPEEARSLADELRRKVSDAEQFAELAQKHSDSPDAGDGGLLGVLSQEDLNPQVFDVVFSLKEGEVSPVQEMEDGFRLFFVEKRFAAVPQEDEALTREVKQQIEQQKLQARLQNFFTDELLRSHSVERKF